MNINHQFLFKSAAIFNLGAGLLLFFAPGIFENWLGLSLTSTAALFVRVTSAAIIGFGGIYWLIGNDPVRFRPLILFGFYLKIIVVLLFYAYWLSGAIQWQLPVIALGDIVYSLLFFLYYHNTKSTS